MRKFFDGEISEIITMNLSILDFFCGNTQQLSAKLATAGEKHLFLTRGLFFLLNVFCLSLFCLLEDWHLGRDSVLYLRTAEAAAEKYYLSMPEGHLYPPLLILIMVHLNHLLGISCKAAGLSFCIICGALCPVIIFSGVYRLFHDYSLALLSGILFFLTPGIRDVSTTILRDAPSLCLNLAGICAFIFFKKTDRSIYMLECGLFLALSIGFRFENIEFLLIIPLLNVFLVFYNSNLSFFSSVKKALLEYVIGVIGFLFGLLLVFVICINCNYYTDCLSEVFRKYSYVI